MASAATVLLLVGPKGSGKSFIGSLLAERLGIPFFRAEPVFLENLSTSRLEGTARDAEGFARVFTGVMRSLKETPVVVLESTGASDAFFPFLGALRATCRVLLVSVRAPPEVCLARVRTRDQTTHINVSDDAVMEINERASKVRLAWDLEIDNGGPASKESIVTAVGVLFHG